MNVVDDDVDLFHIVYVFVVVHFHLMMNVNTIDDVLISIYYSISDDYDAQNPNPILLDPVDVADDDGGNFHFEYDEILFLVNLI